MASLYTESPITFQPNYYDVGVSPDTIGPVNNVITVDINGEPYSGGGGGGDVTLAGVQTLSNKSLVDNSTWFIGNADATIQVMFSCAGTTGTTATIVAVQSANRQYTIPDSSVDTNFVLAASVDTLTNKSLVDASTYIINSTDATKRIKFDESGASTGTTLTLKGVQSANRVLTFPNVTADANFIVSQNNQTIVGTITMTGLTTNTITQATSGTGTTINQFNVRQDALVLSAPSSNITLSSIVATGTNVSVAVIPTGTGAIMAAIPNNSASGGYTRGANSVDWQTSRATAAQVASGATSVIAGGANNTSSAAGTIVSGGLNNVASATYAAVLYGYSCVASGTNSIAAGSQAQSTGPGDLTITDNQAATLINANTNRAVLRFADGYRFILSTGAYRISNQQYVYPAFNGTTSGTSTLTLGQISLRADTVFSYTLNFSGITTPSITAGTYSHLEESGYISLSGTMPTIINKYNIVTINSAGTSTNAFSVTVTAGTPPTLNIILSNASLSTGIYYAGVCTLYINDANNPDPV